MKYFLDCGSHHGEGLLTLIEKYNIDKDWTIFCFEPNTESFNRLINNNHDLNITYLNKCVTDKNGVTLFHAETTTESYGGNDDGAASTCIEIDNWNPKIIITMALVNFIIATKLKRLIFQNLLTH